METRQNSASFVLLRAEDELRLAQEIELRDIEVWTALLSYPPATDVTLAVIDEALGAEAPPHAELLRVAVSAGRAPARDNHRRLDRAARDFAQLLRPLDLDREIRRIVIDRLRDIARGHRPSGVAGLGGSSPGFRAFMSSVRDAERTGIALRERFIHANLRLVMSVARIYRRSGLPYADLVQEGNLGLIKAVDRFDHRRGTRFSTFAVWWIRHSIGRAVADKSRLVRIPVHLTDTKRRMAMARGELATELGRRPTAHEIAERLELPASRVEQLERHAPEVLMSLDAPAADDFSRSWYDSFIEDVEAPDLLQRVVDASVANRLDGLLTKLRPIEADVIRKRFGLAGNPAQTLREIAQEYGLSRERIRQIEQLALASLRDRLEPPSER